MPTSRSIPRLLAAVTAAMLALTSASTVQASTGSQVRSAPAGAEKFGPFDLTITLDWLGYRDLYDVVVVADHSGGTQRDWLTASTKDFAIPTLTEYSARFTTAITGERGAQPRTKVPYRVTGNVVAETICKDKDSCSRQVYLQIRTAERLPGKCAIGHIDAKSWKFGRGKKIGLGICGTTGAIHIGGGNALNELRNPASVRIDKLTFKAPGKRKVSLISRPGEGALIASDTPVVLPLTATGGVCKAKIGGLIDTRNDGKPAQAATRTVSLTFPC